MAFQFFLSRLGQAAFSTLGGIRAQKIVLGFLSISIFLASSPALATELQVAAKPTAALSPLEKSLADIQLTKERNRNSLNQIYEFDRTPLGKRIPVILVPGRAEEFQHDAWWKRLYKDMHHNPLFRHNFKVYAFLYNSKEELDVQANSLATDIQRRFRHLPKEQPLMLVTYSLGGVISRETLDEPGILEMVDTMIAIAVPFHGSPIFDPEWFTEYLNPQNHSPIRRFWDRLIYRAYMFSKSNLTRGLGWDNFDRSKPQFHPETVTVSGDQAHSTVAQFEEYPLADAIRAKTIVYASYLENGYTHSNQPLNPRKLPRFVLDNSLSLPKELVATVLPFYGFTVHSVFTFMNYQLANLPTYTPENPQGHNTHLYRFNDGAIPLSSMLFLKARPTPYADDFDALIQASTTRDVRIFVNLDHMDIGEYRLFKNKLEKPDILHEPEGQRSPNEWIIHDLLERLKVLRDGELVQWSDPLPNQQEDGVGDEDEIKQAG